MLIRPSNAAIALVVVLVGILLATMIPHAPLGELAQAQTAASTISYEENGTDPVATFSAVDPDGDAIEWSISGADVERFTISGGVLAFKESPDYENPNSKSTGTLADRNVYNVTIEATGGSRAVVVNVTNADEDGTVSLTKPQPQVGRGLLAELKDEDGGVTDEKWQWARSEDGETWSDIAGATSPSRNPMTDDVGSYLRATVTYTDSFGSGKTAMAVSDNPVEARTLANGAPTFADLDEIAATRTYVDVTRSVGENTAVGGNVGKPVSAGDPDGDVLVYSLVDTPDLKDGEEARFTIDPSSGQIKIGKKLGADAANTVTGSGTSAEQRLDEDATSDTDYPALANVPSITIDGTSVNPRTAANSMYVLTVRATDPSNASKDVHVIVTVTELPEAPVFNEDAPATLWVTEGVAASLRTGKTDVESGDDANRVVAGTYAASDDDDEAITYSVVEPDDEDFFSFVGGVLTISPAPDYEKRSSYSITIVATSGENDDKRSTSKAVTVNVTDAEDLGSVQFTQLEPQVGRAVVASVMDDDGGVTVSKWQWYRGGTPDGTTGIVDVTAVVATNICGSTGASFPCIIDGASSASYVPGDDDYDDTNDTGYFLTAQATYKDNIQNLANDGTVTDDPTVIAGTTKRDVQLSDAANAAPVFPDQDPNTLGDQSDTATRSVAENTKADQPIGAAVSATDEVDLLLYTISGPDADSFGINRETGQLRTKAELDYETKSQYMVIVTATDPSGASDSIMVTINVTDGPDNAVITAESPISYEENGTDPVATFSAVDPDGDAIEWSISGADVERFTISGGVLAFKESPDYENPNSKSTGTLADRNVYNVTIEATGGSRAVVVNVTNADEDGTVSLTKPQPQVGRGLLAELKDEDGGVTDEKWQWARSEDGETWSDIAGATSPSRNPMTDDVGSYLRATVTYTDSFGSGKTAMAVSDNPVEARTLANGAPTFADLDEIAATRTYVDVTRSVGENTAVGGNVGKPVSAGDPDGDVLVYSLVDTPDLKDGEEARFTIDPSSGQIKIGKKLGADAANTVTGSGTSAEQRLDEDATSDTDYPALANVPSITIDGTSVNPRTAANSMYVLTVRATDPSNASKDVHVIVTVTELPEAPVFNEDAPATLWVTEGVAASLRTGKTDVESGDDANRVVAGTYAASDDDDEAITYSVVEPDDEDFFSFVGGVLTISPAPDYEKRSSYSITIVATSGENDDKRSTSKAVTVNVTDAEDLGSVQFTQLEPQVGRAVVASVMDDDGGVTVSKWQWYRGGTPDGTTGIVDVTAVVATNICGSTGASFPCIIDGASSASYVPGDDDYDDTNDTGYFLTAQATYKDNIQNLANDGTVTDDPTVIAGTTKRDVQLSDAANAAPVFPDQDPNTLGDQSDTATRSVAENTKADQPIGAAVSATDEVDLLLYTISGPDADSFGINRETGQLRTKAELDYETKSQYMVIVTATDPSGASDSIMVTINVTDGPDNAVITLASTGGEGTTDPGEDTTDPGEDTTDPGEDTTDPLLTRFDSNEDGSIDRDEVFGAIQEFLAGDATRDDVLGAIGLFVASAGDAMMEDDSMMDDDSMEDDSMMDDDSMEDDSMMDDES